MLEPGGDIYAEMNRRSVPYGVNLEITAVCNLDCVHCYHVMPPAYEMSSREICKLLDELAALGAMELTITGGEPLSRSDFGEILGHAVGRNGFSVKVFSNLTLLDEAMARTIAETGVNRVETTLLGPDARLHDSMAGMNGAFDRTVAGIRLLKDHSVSVAAKTVAMKENVGRLDELYRFAATLGVPFRHDDGLFVEAGGGRRPLAHRIRDREVRRLRRTAGEGKSTRIRGSCNAAKSVASIGPGGDVYPCGAFPVPAGNVREQSFGDIWRDSPLMRRIRSLCDRDYDVCRGCMYDIRCGGCLAMGAGLAEGRVCPCRLERKTIRRFL